jgi:hypothetical protein
VLPDPRPVQATTVLALATPLRAGFRRCCRSRGDILDCRGAALCRKPGRDEGMVVSDRTKGCCL